MNISPMMIKAMFSALGVSPEEVMTPILTAVQDIQEFKAIAQDIQERLIRIELHMGISNAAPQHEYLLPATIDNNGGEIVPN